MGLGRKWAFRSDRLGRCAALFCFLVVVIAWIPSASTEIVGRLPRVLILYPYDERIAATTAAGEAVRTRLLDATQGKIDLFSEFLDLSRFPESAHIDRMAQYLSAKYADRRPDVVVALGEQSARFIIANRKQLAGNAKIIHAGFSSSTAEKIDLPSDVIGAFTEFDILKTAEMARGLQPEARYLFIIGGSSEFDRWWLATARADLAAFSRDYETTYLEDMTIDEFTKRAAEFPRNSIVLALTIFKDSAGRNFIPREAIRQISQTASAPIYGPYPTYIDYGVVGGNVVTFESLGMTVADLALDALAGKPISNLESPQTYIADARQLQHWGLPEKNLPPGTVQMFREPTFWEQHWFAVVAALAVITAQGIVISGLLIERLRRRKAEIESRRRLLEVVHLNQSATAGALSASIAHELNQPLGAIRSNAEAAAVILRSERPDLKLIEQILIDIQDDDQRAGDIILRMRGLLKKRSEIDWQEFDLNEVTTSAIQILHGEAERKGVVVSSNRPPQALPVRADKVHVQQVILNLATNAIDAMLEMVTTERRLVLETTLTKETQVELSISDTGRGIPDEQLACVFEPFYTTKPTGTGLGLSIARAIVETYGGKIWADNRPEGGAVFRVVLPLARSG
ncbi:HAMP domain-containing histidine kinase [Rhizobium sp. SEMIA 4085]|uniref:histidine kinase n=1 Tax=Rhizobium gallicum bv. gallicum R602sp TaxID=1041138 RepID=A0A0B4X071_9HYPH|nr:MULTISPECIES: HAMP domain-containing sensor histidine kinase [Rhizobium]AJD40185.1 sensor histidine kinase protein [Rhizobium gallicum bv. gallicum R602sp]NNH29779.1 HAMP domain-containing histidine kinase [Rhizobium sp. SEMIA 4085]